MRGRNVSFSLFLSFDSDETVPRLPLLVRIFSGGGIEKVVIVLRRLLVCLEVIVRRGTKKIGSRRVRGVLSAFVQGPDAQFIVLVFTGGDCQVTIDIGAFGVKLERIDQLSFGDIKITHAHAGEPKRIV